MGLVHTLIHTTYNKGVVESVEALYTHPKTVAKSPSIVQIVVHPVIVSKEKLVKFIARHWGVSNYKAAIIVNAAFKYGAMDKVPPLLVLSEIATESSFQIKAYSYLSAVGIMQVYPKAHWGYVLKNGYTGKKYKELFNIVPNIKFGTYILSKYYHAYKTVNSAAAHYFGICSFDKTYVRRIDTNLNLLQQHI
jgi:soluble lytic murein transglycosylase-like protein